MIDGGFGAMDKLNRNCQRCGSEIDLLDSIITKNFIEAHPVLKLKGFEELCESCREKIIPKYSWM